MKIIVDSREQNPFSFERQTDVEVIAGSLATGDYSLPGLEDMVAVERKSLDDLVGCLAGGGRERFERELSRGRALACFAVVVEAGFGELAGKQYRSRMNPHAAAQSVIAFQVRYKTPFIWAGSRLNAEYFTYWTLAKFHKEIMRRYANIFAIISST